MEFIQKQKNSKSGYFSQPKIIFYSTLCKKFVKLSANENALEDIYWHLHKVYVKSFLQVALNEFSYSFMNFIQLHPCFKKLDRGERENFLTTHLYFEYTK